MMIPYERKQVTVLAKQSEAALGSAPILPLMLKMAVPSVLAQIVNMLYNVVDRIFIGHIPDVGDLALTGVGITFPIALTLTAFAAFAGAGGAPLASIKLGEGNKPQAERIMGNSFLMLIVIAIVATTVFSVYLEPLLYAFGATENLIGYSMDYGRIYVLGTIFVLLALGMNPFISAQGKPLVAMSSVAIGAVLNLGLDYILIFCFDMGVQGAAIATVVSQGVSAIWVVGFLMSGRSSLRIRPEILKPSAKIVGSIAALGIAPFVMESTEGLVTIVLNNGLRTFGNELYLGSLTIMQSVMQVMSTVTQGVTKGVQPILGFNYGAKNYARVRKTFNYLLAICVSATLICCPLISLFPGPVARIFTPDEELIALVSQLMPIFLGGFWIFGAQWTCQTTFMAMGQAKTGLFLAMLRKIVLLIPLAIILPRVMNNVLGIFIAEAVADALASCTTLTLFFIRRKTLLPLPADAKR